MAVGRDVVKVGEYLSVQVDGDDVLFLHAMSVGEVDGVFKFDSMILAK